jgi:two-component system cell cycle response regulator CtrA
MHILVVESDLSVLHSFELWFGSVKINAYATDLGEEAIDLGKLYDYDAIVLGTTKDVAPLDIIRQIRTSKVRTPILMLSSLAAIEDKVKALDVGADDHMTTPVHKDEVIARLRSIVRRSKGHAQPKLTAENVVLNMDSRTVEVAGAPVHLTGKEYAMLELLMLRKGNVQSKEQFLNHLYGGMDEPEMKIVDVFMCKLRRKLSNAGAFDLIETVWGRGYLIREGAESIGPELRDLTSSTSAFDNRALAGNGMRRRAAAE